MKIARTRCLKILLSIVACWTFAINAQAKVVVENPHARATFAMAKTGVIYMTLTNHANAEDALTKVEVGAEFAEEAQLHTTFTERNMVRMRQLDEGIKLPPHQNVELLPGGHHIMLVNLKQPLTEDTTIPLTLHFANAKPVEIKASVNRVEDEQKQPHHHE